MQNLANATFFPAPKIALCEDSVYYEILLQLLFFIKCLKICPCVWLSLEKKGARKKLLRLAGVPARNKKILAWIKQLQLVATREGSIRKGFGSQFLPR